MLDVFWSVARNVKCAEASRMLGEFVSPEDVVWSCLADPVGVHPFEQIVLSERSQERANVGAVVGRYYCTIGETSRGIWGRDWVILAREITILSV